MLDPKQVVQAFIEETTSNKQVADETVRVLHAHGYTLFEYHGRWSIVSNREHDRGTRLLANATFTETLTFILDDLKGGKP